MTDRGQSSSLGPLRHRDLRLLLLATTMQTVVMPVQFLSLTFWAIDSFPARAVFYPSLLIGVRGGGMLLMALLGGAIADRFERRHVLLFSEASAAVLTTAMGLCMVARPFDDWAIVPVVLVVLAFAATMGIDQPARAAAIPAIVPAHEVPAAIGLSNVAGQLMFPIVLPIAGYLNDVLAPGEVVLCSLGAWTVSLPALARLRFSSLETGVVRGGIVAEIREGLSYASRAPAVRGVLLTVCVVHVIGMPGVGALGPVWMREVLGLSPSQFGLIGMLWGLGALSASLLAARLHSRAGRGTALAGAGLTFGAAAVVFSHSREPLLTAGANFFLGFGMAAVMVTSSIIVQQLVENRVRGRVMGLFPLVIGASMLNVITAGVVSQRVGITLVFPVLSWAALGGVAAAVIGSRPLRQAGREVPVTAATPVLKTGD